ncbi:arsenic metallochaperone ArsD family protein [Loigolactobacillus coryniformis]|uniref:Arsenic metallochaperone ArsD family protein n=1 Tax=Loigolactobacillus coryniformis TaxID=1610 RepID=A0A5B8TE82_9LACO|nr:arsenic metallochaperone ArsD family protein [Loigolactobacillus coryniformis]MBW4801547.1 arsenic metallochaperone ArsD family protein [Loigolactobacillus coryniformis subsp. torquens]MBW4804248.1 arsenic metallochaperone ArsD family protein [Loigolactobacillus coryniformis subsp. torquens]QEA52757.1 arsenic metallochaperone ArsD family protein [Loigolactobacillus coryniformis]RRG05260.1 MAG: arsenical resistance operon transcriptional repressor ArsD [Lactobacillus sp.]
MTKIELFEAAHYSADNPVMQMIAAVFTALKPVPFIETQRYNFEEQPAIFAQRADIKAVLDHNTAAIFPITVLDGAIVKTGAYPSLDELSVYTDLDFVPANTGGGCCGGADGCSCH